jgi:hypothetical protein
MRTRLCQISLECGFAWLWLMCLGYKYNGRCVHGVVRCAAVGWSAPWARRVRSEGWCVPLPTTCRVPRAGGTL